MVSSALVEAGLSDVSELLFSLCLSLLDHSFENIFFDIIKPFTLLAAILSAFTFAASLLNLRVASSPFKALSSSAVGIASQSSSVLVVADLELPWEPVGRRALRDPGKSGVVQPPEDDDVVALTCSKKRTWTTTLRGRRSF